MKLQSLTEMMRPFYFIFESNKIGGEIFMQQYDACRLIAVNLFSFIDKPFTDESKFNFKRFYEVVYETMRLSDDLIDLELEYVDRILDKITKDKEIDDVKHREIVLWTRVKETAQASRRTGLGFTALGDALAALNLKYDSDEALDIVDKIMHMKMESELDCTIDLSILRGSFMGADTNKEFAISQEGTISYGLNTWYQFVLDKFPEQAYRMAKYNRRNVSFSTVAPTGSVSILTQTTSGLEPLFMPYYMRRKKVNPNDKDVKVDFIDDMGDKWQEFPILHPKFKNWMFVSEMWDLPTWNITDEERMLKFNQWLQNLSGDKLKEYFENSPWYGSTANDIDWTKRVKMQRIIQLYTSHSISSTINLPNTTTEAEVSEIYLESWKQGLKGVTVYVDGSRSGVLVENNTNKKKEERNIKDNNIGYTVIKRPNPLKAKVVRFNNNHEKWIAIVGIVDDRPYELFTGLADELKDIPKHIEEGYIIKRKDTVSKNSVFYFKYDENDNSSEIEISNVFNKEYWNYTKLLSGILRHGMSLEKVIGTVEGLNLDDSHLNTWKAGVLRVLRKFQSTNTLHDRKCPECGDPDGLIFEDGCLKCKSCGHSKCG